MDKMPPILIDLPNEIIGERVFLRPFRTGDGPALWEATEESREHITPWMLWISYNQAPSDSEEYARRAQARWITREGMPMGIWNRESGELLGQCLLARPDWSVPSIEMGYWIRASAHGKGYVSEAAKLMITMAFEVLGVQRLQVNCDSLNHRSAAVAKRLGFKLEATLRNNERSASGELRDTLVFAMTPEDYALELQNWSHSGSPK